MIIKTPKLMPAIGILAACLLSAPAIASDELSQQFTTAAGSTLDLPAVPSLECDEMDGVLTRIDATRYRENAPTPHNPSDLPLFVYETELAEAHFKRCVGAKTSTGGFRMLFRPANN